MDAGYDRGNRQGCLSGTREDVFREIQRWLADEQGPRIFWLDGPTGTGKSAIAQTFAESASADGKLGASFFCSREFKDRSDLQMIFPTLAFQLAYRYSLFGKELLQILKTYPDVGRESLCSQMEKLIVGPLKAADIQTLIIIDALDECKDEEPTSAILSIFSRYVHEIPDVKIFITGRPEPRIHSGFHLAALRPITEVLKLHDVERSLVDDDIKLFLRTRLTSISETRYDYTFPEGWPGPFDIDTLCQKAAGLFSYASTVVGFVESEPHLPTKWLTPIISLPRKTAHEEMSRIDLFYTQILGQEFRGKRVNGDEELFFSHFRTIVGAILLTFNPLSATGLSDLLGGSDVSTSLRSLHSILAIPDSTEDPIRIFHKPLLDFLTDPGRCTDQRFFIDPSACHRALLLSCFGVMKRKLRRNILKLDDHTILSKVKDLPTRRESEIGEALEYACCFWASHLVMIPGESPGVKEVLKAIDEFFTTSVLLWIEVLSLTENLDVGVRVLDDVRKWCVSVRDKLAALQNMCSHFFRLVPPLSGQTIVNVSYWITSTQSVPPPPTFTILPSRSVLPPLASTNITVQSSHPRSKWLWGSRLNGEHVPAQFPSTTSHKCSHAKKTLSQSG